MLRRLVTSLGVAVFFTTLTVAPVLAAGQTQTAPSKSPVSAPKTDAPGVASLLPPAAKPPKNYIGPRTPWGDPDISGQYTTKDEANTPFERPDEWAGKRIEDITPQEMVTANEQRQRTAIESAPFITGSRQDGIAIGVPIHWMDHLDAVNSRPWFVIDPPDGKVPPTTEEGIQRAEANRLPREGHGTADSFLDRSLWDRCIARNVPQFTAGVYNNSFHILQTKDYVAIRYEMIHETRLIPIEGRGSVRPHNNPTLHSYFGDAVGRWDGNSLVVDTRNFDPKMNFRGSNANLHLVERFTRTGPHKIEVTTTVEDPKTWARPWTYTLPLTEDDGQPIHEYACHEGNYGLRNILSAGRSDDTKGIKSSNGPALPPGVEE